MIRHIVMWRVAHVDETQRLQACARIQDAFHSLRGKIPGMRKLQVDLDTSRVDYASDVVLLSEFVDRAALLAYAVHPEHLRVRTELTGIRIESRQVDYVFHD